MKSIFGREKEEKESFPCSFPQQTLFFFTATTTVTNLSPPWFSLNAASPPHELHTHTPTAFTPSTYTTNINRCHANPSIQTSPPRVTSLLLLVVPLLLSAALRRNKSLITTFSLKHHRTPPPIHLVRTTCKVFIKTTTTIAWFKSLTEVWIMCIGFNQSFGASDTLNWHPANVLSTE